MQVTLVGRPGKPTHTRAHLHTNTPPPVLRVVAVPDHNTSCADRDPHLTEVYEWRRHPTGAWAYVFTGRTTREGMAA